MARLHRALKSAQKAKHISQKKNLEFDDSICNVRISWSNNYTQMHIFAFEIEPFLEF